MFKRFDKVILIGDSNPYNGQTGIFQRYGKKDKVWVRVNSTKRIHWFNINEVKEDA